MIQKLQKWLEEIGLRQPSRPADIQPAVPAGPGGPGKYYVSYVQDCGFGAAMHCHAVVVAENWQHCYDNYEDLIRKTGSYSVQDAYDQGPVACFYLADQTQEEAEVLSKFQSVSMSDQWVEPEETG